MAGSDDRAAERNLLMNRLLDAVKQCQVRFGGKRELATDSDGCVTCLCNAWEATLQHGLRHTKKALSTFKQVTELTGLTGVLSDIRNMETEPVFWQYVREHLTKHEHDRYLQLKSISTEAGRGRAWLRSCLNEASLEKYMHMLISNDSLLVQFYEDGAFLRDQECSSMLPMMAAGLTSILFAIRIDDVNLNAIKRAQGLDMAIGPVVEGLAEEVDHEKPVVTADSYAENRKDKKKRKKPAKLISFDEEARLSCVKKPDLPPIENLSLAQSLVTTDESPRQSADFEDESLSQKSSSLTNLYSENDVFDSPRILRREKKFSKEDSFSDTTSIYTSAPTSPICATSSGGQFGNYDVVRMTSQTVPLPQPMTSTFVPAQATSMTSCRVRKPSSSPSETSRTSMDSDTAGVLSADAVRLVPVMTDESDLNISLYQTNEDALSVDSDQVFYQQPAQDVGRGLRTAGDGSYAPEMALTTPSVGDFKATDPGISSQDLRQAVVAMMMRKDEVEEENRSLRSMLDEQIETSNGLQAELEQLRAVQKQNDDANQNKIMLLTRDNDLLKHQLKKYVNAVQLLRREGISAESKTGIHLDEVQPPLPERKPDVDYSHEASEYEKKLIQVAEMHGELMEFNERLHMALDAKERLVGQLKRQLEELRGPLPPLETAVVVEAGAGTDSITSTRPLINIWIPSVFYSGSGTDAHHAYQVYTRIGDDEWNVYRRYQQFFDLHNKLKKIYPITATFDFPKKKVLGNKDKRFVEERRKKLQLYLRCVVNVILNSDTRLAENVCKQSLIQTMPLLDDSVPEKTKKRDKKKATPSPSVSRGRGRDPTPGDYTGI